MLVIDESTLRELVPIPDAIGAVSAAFAAVSAGEVWQPRRLVDEARGTLVMAAAAERAGTVVKTVSIKPENAGRGLPTVRASALWVDGETGTLTALIDGSALTALRTGAASGAATNALAAPDASVLAMVGAGAQARDQIESVRAVRDIQSLRIASRTLASAERLAQAVAAGSDAGLDISVHPTPTQAVAGADIVCCATLSEQPLFPVDALKSRVHINAIGAYRPGMCEIGIDVLDNARLIAVDQVTAASVEAGDLIRAVQSGALTLDVLVELGNLEGSYLESDGITVFKSVGLAAQDWAVARLAVTRASAARAEG